MSNTVVSISILSGPSVPASPSYVIWESAYRISDGAAVTVPAPGAVRLDSNGQATVSVASGAWYVTEVVPGGASRRRALIVPESDSAVAYADLDEVTDPGVLGIGPTWEQAALNYSIAARASADAAQDYYESLAGISEAIEAGTLVRTVNSSPPDENGNVVITVDGTIVVNSITDAKDIGKSILLANDAAAVRALIGSGTGSGGSSNVDYRLQAADGSYPAVGAAPDGQLLLYIGATPPDPATTRAPRLYFQGAAS